jgi:hypothetical protein
MSTLEEKKQKIASYAKWGLGALAAFVVAPVIFLVVKGIVGLMIAGLLGLVVINAAPFVAMKLANWKIKAIKYEAGANPIETLENLLIAKREAFNVAVTEVTKGVAARDDFAVKTRAFARQYPARAAEFEQKLAAMTALIERKKDALQAAQTQLKLADDKLDEMRAYWDMSQAAQAANAAVQMDTGDLYERMKADTAYDAVMSSFNQAFAELEVTASLTEADSPGLLIHKPRNATLDFVEVVEPVKVLAK